MANLGNRLKPNAAQIIYTVGTATGSSTDFIMYGAGYREFGVASVMSGTTKDVTFAIEGSIGEAGAWTALMAGDVASTTTAVSGLTGWAFVNTTVAQVVDRVRITVSANTSTSTGTQVAAWIVPVSGG